jgi:hypothetical protein
MIKELMDIEHKFDKKILAQNDELAKVRRDESLKAMLSKTEDDNIEMKMDIKVTNVMVLILPAIHASFYNKIF